MRTPVLILQTLSRPFRISTGLSPARRMLVLVFPSGNKTKAERADERAGHDGGVNGR